MDLSVADLADELGIDPGDVHVILRQHDVYADDLSVTNARDVRIGLDPNGDRMRCVDLAEPRYGSAPRIRRPGPSSPPPRRPVSWLMSASSSPRPSWRP